MTIESQGTKIEIESGSGAAKTITGITLGAITEITSVAHGLAVGDVVAFASIGGTTELNGKTAMVIAKEADSFFVAIDSSGYSAFTSGGTATPAAYTEVGEVVDWDGPTGEANVIDTTNLKSTRREKMMGIPDEGQISLSVNWDPSDVGQQAVRAARAARSEKGFRITYSDGTVQTFDGYVLGFSSSGGVDDKVNGSITIEITGEVATA